MTEHTPGPWIYDHAPDNQTSDDTYSIYSESHDGTLADVYPWYDADGKPTVDVTANARLIAASPDLLAALEDILDSGPDFEHCAELALRARAAIAKAKGE